MGAALFVGVAVGEYRDKAFKRLDRAVPDVDALAGFLRERGYQVRQTANPTAEEARRFLKKALKGLPAGSCLVVLWTGHGAPAADTSLHLIASDTEPGSTPEVTVEYLAGLVARSGAGQALLLLDTCYAGGGVVELARVYDLVTRERETEGMWFGVLAAALDFERARDGVFMVRLMQLLREGPMDPELRTRWSWHNAGVRGDDVIDALVKQWTDPRQTPKPLSFGDARPMFANPQFNPAAPERIVEHLLLAADGRAPGEEGVYFTGRVAQLGRLADWMGTRQPGVFVVTGPAGCGKSAIVGRLVALSDRERRRALLAAGPLEHADPGEGSIHAHVHARRLTVEQVAERIDEQLVRHDVLPPRPGGGRRNRGDLLGDLLRVPSPPVIVLDGLDEAGPLAWEIARDLVGLLAGSACVIVATRELPPKEPKQPGLLQTLKGTQTIDLGDAAVSESTRADVREYVRRRLAGIAEATMDAGAVADAVAGLTEQTHEGAFQLASIVTSQLRTEPVDTSAADWRAALSTSLERAFEKDVARTGDPDLVHELLAALAWSYGPGVPDDIWAVIATALSTRGATYKTDDAYRALAEAGRYVVEAGEGGRAVYRLAHQRLVEFLHPPAELFQLGRAGSRAAKVASALVDLYLRLLRAGRPAADEPYLRQYTWQHCADGGSEGIKSFRQLVAADRSAFLPDLAEALVGLSMRYGYSPAAIAPAQEAVEICETLPQDVPRFCLMFPRALLNLGVCYRRVGRDQEAVPVTEQAVERYVELVTGNPASRKDLADARLQLGKCYFAVGRWQEAVAATQEAVEVYRELAEADPARLPDLCMALVQLGNSYSQVGRYDEALDQTRKAVARYRELLESNPALLPDLASALTNLSNHYCEVGCRQEAVAVAKEATAISSRLVQANPNHLPLWACAAGNLGVRYSEVGRYHEAIGPTEAAVKAYRALAKVTPAFLDDLADQLNNLANRYSQVGRWEDVIKLTRKALATFKKLAQANPRFLPRVAGTLSNLGLRCNEAGHPREAIDYGKEAVGIYRELVGGNPALLSELAQALDNLGLSYDKAAASIGDYESWGFHNESVLRTEEAKEIYEPLAKANPAFLPGLAFALSHLGNLYSQFATTSERALDHTKEAVRVYATLAKANPAFLHLLADELDNLGERYWAVGCHGKALVCTKKALERYERLAVTNPAVLKDMAMALKNLGARYAALRRFDEAVDPTEKAVEHYRTLAEARPAAFLPGLADALSCLGVRYSEARRHEEALDRTREAAKLYSELAEADPAFLGHLTDELYALENRYADLGRTAEIDAVWSSTLARMPEPSRASLLVLRARGRPAADRAAIDDLLAAAALAPSDPDLHDVARQRRAADAASFDEAWRQATGGLPAWLTLDPALWDAVDTWLNTSPATAQRDFLAAHAEALLSADAQEVLTEIELRSGKPDACAAMRRLLAEVRDMGVAEAYRGLIACELLLEWMSADPETKRSMLRERRDALIGEDVAAVLASLRNDAPENESLLITDALLTLARHEREDLAFVALADPGQFPTMLADLARKGEQYALAALAVIALSCEGADRACAMMHYAIAMALEGRSDEAMSFVTQARSLDASQVPAWLGLLVEVAPAHPEVVPLSRALSAPS